MARLPSWPWRVGVRSTCMCNLSSRVEIRNGPSSLRSLSLTSLVLARVVASEILAAGRIPNAGARSLSVMPSVRARALFAAWFAVRVRGAMPCAMHAGGGVASRYRYFIGPVHGTSSFTHVPRIP